MRMSTDVRAVLGTCPRVTGLDPEKVPYLAQAAEFLGNADPRRIEQRGERPDRYAAQFDVLDMFKEWRL